MRTPLRNAAPALALALALASVASAGPVRAQTPDTTPAAPEEQEALDRWRFGADFALTSASGNEEITVLTSGLEITHLIEEEYELEFGTSYRYGRSDGEEVARNLRAQLKFDFQPEADFSPFLFASGERDPFRKLDLRAHGGAGAKYRLWRAERGQEATLSVAALYSYEAFRVERAPGVDPFARDARASWRFKGVKLLAEDVRVENTTFYQPVWDRYGDYLFTSETAVRMVVNEWVALTFGYSFERDSTPIEGVEQDDRLLRAGLSLQW